MICTKDHFTKDLPYLLEGQQYIRGHSSQLVVLMNPSSSQQQQMVASNPTPLQWVNVGYPQQGDA